MVTVGIEQSVNFYNKLTKIAPNIFTSEWVNVYYRLLHKIIYLSTSPMALGL